MKHIRKVSHQIIIYLTILSVCACSTTSRMNIIQPGDTVSIVLASEITNEKLLKIHNNDAISEDVKTGAYMGAASGAAYGLVCGPWFFLCSPYFAVLGAAGGVVAGVGVGVLTNDFDKKKLLYTKMDDYLKTNNPQKTFLTRVISLAESRYSISSSSDKEISVLVERLTFNAIKDGRVILEMNSAITINYLDKSGQQQSATINYEYISPPQFVDTWLEGSDEFYKIKLTDAYNTLAEHMLRTL
jgi:hypothetical protein